MLEIFYQSVVAGAIFFAAVCLGSSIRASDINILDNIIKKAGFAQVGVFWDRGGEEVTE